MSPDTGGKLVRGQARLETRRFTALFLLQTCSIIVLFYWLVREREANPYMGIWESQNFPVLSSLISWTGLYLVSGALLALVAFWTLNFGRGGNPMAFLRTSPRTLNSAQSASIAPVMIGQINVQLLRPFYELVEFRKLITVVALLAQSLTLWILTATTFTITTLPPDSFYYLSHLPIWYWWGLAATLGL